MTHPSGIPVFERFFRSVASINIDKNDVRRFRELVDEEIDDIAIAGRNSAKLSIALARSFRVVDPTVSNPSTEHWNRAFTLFRLVF